MIPDVQDTIFCRTSKDWWFIWGPLEHTNFYQNTSASLKQIGYLANLKSRQQKQANMSVNLNLYTEHSSTMALKDMYRRSHSPRSEVSSIKHANGVVCWPEGGIDIILRLPQKLKSIHGIMEPDTHIKEKTRIHTT